MDQYNRGYPLEQFLASSQRIRHISLKQHSSSIVQALAKELTLDKPKILELMQLGAVYANGSRALADRSCRKNDLLRVHLQPKRFALPTLPASSLVVFESENFLVAYKPKGLSSHPTLDNYRENLWHYLQSQGDLIVTHRLDQFTAGLICYAKNSSAAQTFHSWLMNQKINKNYVAIAPRPLAIGQLKGHIAVKGSPPFKVASAEFESSKTCELEILSHKRDQGGFVHHELRLITGRTHQIRAQFAANEAPLLGDRLYGSLVDFSRPSLIATQIETPQFRVTCPPQFETLSLP